VRSFEFWDSYTSPGVHRLRFPTGQLLVRRRSFSFLMYSMDRGCRPVRALSHIRLSSTHGEKGHQPARRPRLPEKGERHPFALPLPSGQWLPRRTVKPVWMMKALQSALLVIKDLKHRIEFCDVHKLEEPDGEVLDL